MDYLAAIPISNARTVGVKMLAVGVAILGSNAFGLLVLGRYYPITVPFGFPALLAGVCLLVIGQPRSASGRPALWGRVLLVSSATIGAGIGIAVSFLLLGWPDQGS